MSLRTTPNVPSGRAAGGIGLHMICRAGQNCEWIDSARPAAAAQVKASAFDRVAAEGQGKASVCGGMAAEGEGKAAFFTDCLERGRYRRLGAPGGRRRFTTGDADTGRH